MSPFETLFGIDSRQVKKNCILAPYLNKRILSAFNIKSLRRAKLYSSGQGKDFTFIHTGTHPGLTGDAVLRLKQSPCENLILFGSCGLTKPSDKLNIGSLVSPFRCFGWTSFSQMLSKEKTQPEVFYYHKELFNDFSLVDKKQEISLVTCATLASLQSEEEMLPVFEEMGIDAVDLQCSVFFCAASSVGLKAMALFYISDIIQDKPFYAQLDPILKVKLFLSLRKAARLIREYAGKVILSDGSNNTEVKL